MFKTLSFKLALRFRNSKRYGPLAKFISFASTAGICTGVCALIVGLSAMNGFEYELNNRVLSLIPAASLESYTKDGFESIDLDLKRLEDSPGVLASAPVISLNGAFSHQSDFAPAKVMGISPEKEKKVIALERFMDCKIDALNSDDETPPVILGYGIAKDLKLNHGDEVSLATIDAGNVNGGLSSMVNKTFKIVGFFKTGGQIDHNFAFINLNAAKELADIKAPNTIHIKVKDMLDVNDISFVAANNLSEPCEVKTWITTQGKLYSDINMIRNIMYLAMILIIAVACFNIVSNLVMAVSEKQREIAILITMGTKKSLIIRTFTLMGVLSAIKGCTLGCLSGCVISLLTPYVTGNFKNWFGVELLNENVYFINFVPSKLMFTDVAIVVCCALVMSFIASIYPAIKASRINPAKVLTV